MIDPSEVTANLSELAEEFRAQRRDRFSRTSLDPDDFARIAETGFWKMAARPEHGGAWEHTSTTTRTITEQLRILGRADPAVALVASMHPGVALFWLAVDADDERWRAQRDAVSLSAANGEQWGTMSSEPGSGGDISRTKTIASPADLDTGMPGETFTLAGQKHFASGSSVVAHMMTVAKAEGAETPALFIMPMAGRAWDGSTGLRQTSQWDAMGMAATESHGFALEGMPAVKSAWPGPIEDLGVGANPSIAAMFLGVIIGVLDEAVETARVMLADRRDGMRSLEQHEWVAAERGHWLALAAYEEALRAVDASATDPLRALYSTMRAKYAVAELAEDVTRRLCRVIGGSAFSASSPFSHWHEDVRALGFLRPPWPLAHDQLFETSF